MEPMTTKRQDFQNIPWKIVGSTRFGRYPKISHEQTFNMIAVDDFLVDYAGYKNVAHLNPNGKGRGIYSCTRAGKMYAVVGNGFYSIGVYASSNRNQRQYIYNKVGELNTLSGDVFMDANNGNQIGICDKHKIYIYNYVTGEFTTPELPEGFNPGYIAFHDGYFLIPDTNSSLWLISALNDGNNLFPSPSNTIEDGSIQTKPDLAQAVIPIPGRGNLVLALGTTVAELWSDIGSQPFPYKKNTQLNLDYGCVNNATIARSDKVVAWLASNEKSGPVIMYTTGSDVVPMSFDGLNYRFSQLVYPEQSTAFFVKLAGRLLYQLTFYHPKDNLSLLFDFESNQFYTLTDENWNYHIARHVAFFDNDYYFVSINDGNLYQMSAEITEYDYGTFIDGSPKVYEIPRARVCKNVRLPTGDPFVINNGVFTIEQGEDSANEGSYTPDYHPRIDISVSLDGGYNFSSYKSISLNPAGYRQSQPTIWGLGYTNDFVSQLRFWSKSRIAISDGILSTYK